MFRLLLRIQAGDGTVTAIEETVTTLVDNGDGTFTYTSEDGTQTTYDETTTTIALKQLIIRLSSISMRMVFRLT